MPHSLIYIPIILAGELYKEREILFATTRNKTACLVVVFSRKTEFWQNLNS